MGRITRGFFFYFLLPVSPFHFKYFFNFSGDCPESNTDSSAWSNDEVRIEDERKGSRFQQKGRSFLGEDGGGKVVSAVPETHNRCCGSHYWCISDACGIVCVFFTWLLVFYAEFVVVRVILWPDITTFYSAFNFFIFQFVTILAICSHTRTMLTDPVSRPSELFNSLFICIFAEP